MSLEFEFKKYDDWKKCYKYHGEDYQCSAWVLS